MSVGRIAPLCMLCTLGPLALALTGCAFSGGRAVTSLTPPATGGSTTGSSTAKAGLGGKVYGGQNPITGAAVTLWAAGTTGTYGTGATSIATTTTDPTGAFSFNNSITGASPCTPGQYLYITSVGGNSGGGTNQYAALVAALPIPCTAGTGANTTAGTSVVVNEVTTIASVTALQQFMTIAPGSTPAWTIGAPAANATGLANAFTQVGNLVNISTGTSSPTTPAATYNSVTYTTTITPDTNKIYALADILAACINTPGSSICTSLFADTTPGAGVTPTDTIQAAYNLATNAGGMNLPAHATAQGEPYYLCSTYILGTPPFQPYGNCTSTSYPTDWAIGVGWSTSNGTTTVGTANPYSLAIDGNGNVWTAYSVVSGSSTNPANITEFNPAGQVQFTPVASTTITTGPTTQLTGGTPVSYSPNFTATLTGGANPTVNVLSGRGNDLAIDTNNNAWFAAYNTAAPATTGGLQGLLTEVTPAGSANGVLVPALVPGVIAIDGSNNIYIDDEPATSGGSARFYTSELESSNATHTGAYAVFNEGIDRQTATEEVVWADNSGYVWSVASGGKCTPPNATIYRGNTAEMEADGATGVSADDVTGASGCPLWGGFADGSGGAYFTQSGSFGTNGLYHMAISGGSASKTAPVLVSEAAGTGTSNGGLDGGNGTFVDGLGNVWVVNSAGGVSEFSYSGSSFTPLSPSGTATVPVYGFGTSYLTGTTPFYAAADASGNLWIGSSGSTLHYLVGIAGPTVTPISQMLKTSFIGSRPGALTLATLGPALTFNTVTSTPQSLTTTLTNTGSANVNIGTISFGGTNPGDFSVGSKTCGTTLAIGANCTITVAFNSSSPGTFTGTLIVASNAAGTSVNLSGTAAASVGTVDLSAGSIPPSGPSIAFGSVVAGSTTSPQAVVLTNNGATAMTLGLGTSGAGANLFPETTNCGSSLAAGASCFVSFTFGPKVAGNYSAGLNLTNNAGTTPNAVSLSGTATASTITVNNSTAATWVIDNGAITFHWNSGSGNLNSWVLDGFSDQLVDTTASSSTIGLYMDNTGSLDNASVPSSGGVAATPTFACTIVSGTQVGTQTTPCTVATGPTPYLDWSETIPDSANSGNAYTFVEHWVVFPNDPGVHTYVQLVHSASDAAASVGQIQWVFRDNLSTFTNTYSVNPGLNILGVQDIPQPPVADTASTDPGRVVQNAAEDLHGFNNLPAGFTRQFYTKYDYAGYEYLHQGQGVYGTASSGTTYGIWTVMPKTETLVGGPTKQDLFFTNNLDMIEAYSDHEDEALDTLGLQTAASVPYNRLFGPFYVHVNALGPAYNQTGNTLATQADMYADALTAGAALTGNYDNVAPLVAAGYTPSTGRGSVSIQVNGISGLPLPQYTAWAVLSDPNKNFQVSSNGMQYWADISNNGAATFTGVVPGTYRLSVYVLGQWGEYRQDGITVTANATTTVPAVSFQPEKFADVTGETVFTIGNPDRSAHEFLHGHTASGNDDREFYGNWNYWMDFAANSGAVVYYATADGSNPATNNLNLWNYNHWGTSFDPGLYDPNTVLPPNGVPPAIPDNTYGYNDYSTPFGNSIPTYVAALPGASGTNGVTTGIPSWQVHFATPTNYASEAYVVLSVAVACDEGSYVVALNGHSYTWSRTNLSDCMVRSGLSGYTQWFVMQWPTADLTQSAGADNVITIGMSQVQGASDDALRLELTNTSAAPATTGWNDYTFLNGSTTFNNDTIGNP